MEDRYILIVGASFEQVPLIEKAQDLGYKTIVIDMDENAPGMGLSNISEVISTVDVQGALQLARKYAVEGVVTNASESSVLTVSKLCEELGLPGISVDVAMKATDKELMKKAFKEKGIPTADFFAVSNLKDAMMAVQTLGLPCIVKPVDGAGSRGVLRIDQVEEVEPSFGYAMSFSKKGRCIVESFIEGVELSADAIARDGNTQILGIADKEVSHVGKTNVAMTIVYPARLSQEERALAKELVQKASESLGIHKGPSHTELIRRGENDFFVIETAARGGGFYTFSKIMPLISGVDTMKLLIDQAVGNRMESKIQFSRAGVLRFMTAEPGRIVKLDGEDTVKSIDGVADFGFFKQKGDYVEGLEKDGDRIGFMIIVGDTPAEALKISESVMRSINIQTEIEL